MTDYAEPTPARFFAAVPRILAGLLLIAAAFLKFYSPAEAATLQVIYNLPSWLILIGTQLELALGVALLTGVFPGPMRRLAIVVLACFAAFSLYRLWGGHESCGCFGALIVPPWLTLAIDLTLLVGLMRQASVSSPYGTPLGALIAYLLVGSPMLVSTTVDTFRVQLQAKQLIDTSQSFTVLEPETWVGHPFPLSEWLEPAIDITKGDWTLLFYHHDCPDCLEVLPKYEKLATKNLKQILLIEVPPFGPSPSFGAAHMVQLSDRREWFVQAPVQITVLDNIVSGVTRDLQSDSDALPVAP